MGGARTHPVVEGVLRAGHAAVVAAVWLRGDDAPYWRVERPAEGGGGRAGGRHLAVDGGGAGLGLLQRHGGVRDPAQVHLLPRRTHIWNETENIWDETSNRNRTGSKLREDEQNEEKTSGETKTRISGSNWNI